MEPVMLAPIPAELEEQKREKQKAKVRSAWISFVGRIVAQILGAGAAVVLGLMVFRQSSMENEKGGAGGEAASQQSTRVSRTRTPGQVGLAVLPLAHLSTDPRQEYLADGLTDALIGELSQVEGLGVISRTSSMYYKGQRRPLPEIAQALGVDYIVEGTVLRESGRIRISVQLIEGKSDERVWGGKYERDFGEVLRLQSEVSAAIAREVEEALAGRRGQESPPLRAGAVGEAMRRRK